VIVFALSLIVRVIVIIIMKWSLNIPEAFHKTTSYNIPLDLSVFLLESFTIVQ
jgi:hypothetical protein